VLRELKRLGLPAHGWSGSSTGELFDCPLQPVDLADADAVAHAFAAAQPKVVLHAAAMAKVADCHRDPGPAQRINGHATGQLAELSRQAGARLLFVSTDLVFDGKCGNYREQDEAAPLSVYGRTKLAGERALLDQANGVVARVSLLYGPSLTGRPTFFDEQVAALTSGRPLNLFVDEWRTPLDLPTAASALVQLLLSDRTGLFHIGGPQRLSRWEMGQEVATLLGKGGASFVAAKQADASAPEPRPRDVSLDSSKWRAGFPELSLPTMREALRRMADT
jgi:dTDP-4-dehydrorhamnose reductase